MRKRKSDPNATLEEVTWKDVRDNLYKVNQELTEIIDEIKPTDKMTLFRLRCPFGTELLRHGRLFLPDKYGNFLPLSEFPSAVRDKLGYNLDSNPAGVILDKAAELFLPLENRNIPYAPVFPGKIFGLWRLLDDFESSFQPIFVWGMTAGARTIFMLPKITEAGSHYRMQRKTEMDVDKPKHLLDHWHIFKEIVKEPSLMNDWIFDVVFFSIEWFKNLKNKKFTMLYNYYLKSAWDSASYLRNQGFWNAVYSIIQNKRDIKVPAFYTDVVKHLIAIGVGALPGFAPATNEHAAPIKKIQEIYINEYGLKDYLPIIMHPSFFLFNDVANPVYYSLNFQTAFELAPKSNDRSSTITDLHIVQSILKKYLSEIRDNDMNLSYTPVYELVKKVDFDFFHSDTEEFSTIRNTSEIFLEDANYSKILAKHKGHVFPDKSTFLRGCVRISIKK